MSSSLIASSLANAGKTLNASRRMPLRRGRKASLYGAPGATGYEPGPGGGSAPASQLRKPEKRVERALALGPAKIIHRFRALTGSRHNGGHIRLIALNYRRFLRPDIPCAVNLPNGLS